jgi:hypothetical protein
MTVAIVIILLALACVVLLVVSAPLRAAARNDEPPSAEPNDLEAAREAVYREIRDAELDYRTGKLTQADYELIDRDLRARALSILDRLGESESTSESRAADGPDGELSGGEGTPRAREPAGGDPPTGAKPRDA